MKSRPITVADLEAYTKWANKYLYDTPENWRQFRLFLEWLKTNDVSTKKEGK